MRSPAPGWARPPRRAQRCRHSIPSKWFAGALTSSNGALSFELHTKASAARLDGQRVGARRRDPVGSLVALSLVGGSSIIPANLQSQVNGLSTTLGINVTGLLGLLNGPVIVYVRAGLPLPEVTIAAKPSNPAQATAAIGQLIARLGQKATPVPTQVDGGTLEKLDLGAVSILLRQRERPGRRHRQRERARPS